MDTLPHAEIGRRIAEKREKAGFSPEQLANALGVSPGDLASIEAGTHPALSGDLVLVAARVLQVDFRYFVTRELDAEDAQTRRVYRALKDPTPADEFRLRFFFHVATADAELRSMLGKEVLERLPAYAPTPPLGQLFRDHGREVARAERARLRLGDAPIENIFDVLRAAGVRVQRQRFPNSGLSGLTAVHPRAGTAVLVNYTDDLYRQIFSAAHEYAHVLLDRPFIEKNGCVVSYDEDTRDYIEVRANNFAAEFLLPLSAMRSKWAAPASEADVEAILKEASRLHCVNTETALYAMGDRGLAWLDGTAVDRWKARRPRIPPKEKRDPDVPPGLTELQRARVRTSMERGLDRPFVGLVADALRAGEITIGRAAEFMAIRRDEVRAFFQEVGV